LREPQENFVSSWRYYSNFYEGLRSSLPLYKDGPLAGSYIKNSRGIRLNFLLDTNFRKLFHLNPVRVIRVRVSVVLNIFNGFYHDISFWFLLVELRALRMMLSNDFSVIICSAPLNVTGMVPSFISKTTVETEFQHLLFDIFLPLNDIIDGILKSQRIFILKTIYALLITWGRARTRIVSRQPVPSYRLLIWSIFFYFRK